MKLINYYTLSNLSFINVDSFKDIQKGDIIKLKITEYVVAIDQVKNFNSYTLSSDMTIAFSNQEPDLFMLLQK